MDAPHATDRVIEGVKPPLRIGWPTAGGMTLKIGACNQCSRRGVPVVAIDASGGEYGPHCLCRSCLSHALACLEGWQP